MTDINCELAEDAAEDYSDNGRDRYHFIRGWLWFCDDRSLGESCSCHPESHFTAGYIAARDAPE